MVKLRAELLDNTRNALLLLLKGLILGKMRIVLLLEGLEDVTLIGCTRVDLHQLLNGVQVVVQGHAILHDLLLSQSDCFQLGQLLFDTRDGGVVCDILCIG